MSHLTTPQSFALPQPVAATEHASLPGNPVPALVHYRQIWHFTYGLTSSEIEHVSCRACLQHLREELNVTCHHQLSKNTRFEPGEYCENLALPGGEYCEQHAADHGDHTTLAQWEDAI